MQDSFDHYQQWLGIPPAEQPPDHYRLLGIAPFENDPAVIQQAIAERIAYVRACAGGQHPEALEDLLGDLATAKHLLLNPTFKQQYDLMLRGRQRSALAVARPAAVEPSPAVVAEPVAAAPQIATNVQPATTTHPVQVAAAPPAGRGQSNQETNGSSIHPGVIAAVVGGGMVLLGLLLFLIAGGGSDDARTSRDRPSAPGRSPGSPRSSSKSRSPARRSPRRGSTSSQRSRPPHAFGSRTFADLMGQDDDAPPDLRSTTGLLKAARMAMADRQMETARHHVESAGKMARSPTERAEAKRVEKLLAALETFWKAVREEAGRLQSGEEIAVGSTRVIAVEARDDRLIMRVAGKNRIYEVTGGLPRQVAVALAERGMAAGSPSANVPIGAFLAVDAKGDREEARRRLEHGGAEGKALLPELKMTGPVKSSKPNAESPKPTRRAGDDRAPGSGPSAPATGRRPVPGVAALADAKSQIHEVLAEEFAAARDKPAKTALAKKMYDLAEQTRDDPALRYALYQAACNLAIELGDPESFFWAIDRMDAHFQIDAIGMKAEGLAKAWREQTEREPREAIYAYSLRLVDEAMKAKSFRAADRVVRIATAGAKAAKNYALVRQLEQKARDIRASL